MNCIRRKQKQKITRRQIKNMRRESSTKYYRFFRKAKIDSKAFQIDIAKGKWDEFSFLHQNFLNKIN